MSTANAAIPGRSHRPARANGCAALCASGGSDTADRPRQPTGFAGTPSGEAAKHSTACATGTGRRPPRSSTCTAPGLQRWPKPSQRPNPSTEGGRCWPARYPSSEMARQPVQRADAPDRDVPGPDGWHELAVMCFKRHPDGRWGLEPQRWANGHTDFRRPFSEQDKPWLLRGQDHGTQVVLLGGHERHDTTQAPPSVTDPPPALDHPATSTPASCAFPPRSRCSSASNTIATNPDKLQHVHGEQHHLKRHAPRLQDTAEPQGDQGSRAPRPLTCPTPAAFRPAHPRSERRLCLDGCGVRLLVFARGS
jgi:hypothetical protein